MSRTFTTEEGLEVEYTFYKDDGTYIDPPSVQIDIESITYNGINIMDLLYEIADDYCWSLTEKLQEING